MKIANPQATTHTHTKQPKQNTEDGHLTSSGENKRGRREKRPMKTNQKQLRKWQ